MPRLTTGLAALVAVATMLAAPAASRAELLGYDPFESYTVGQTLDGKTGGTGFTGAWGSGSKALLVDASMSYQQGDLSVQGGNLAVAAYGSGADAVVDNVANRPFASQTGPVYFSLLFMSPNAVSGKPFIQYTVSNDNDHHNAGSIGHRTDTNNGFFARIRTDSADIQTTSGPAATADETYFLVGKFSKASGSSSYNRMELWVNPTTADEPTGPADYLAYLKPTDTGSGATSLAHFLIRQAHYTDTQWIVCDELRIGTTYGDVVTVVPEPATWVLLLAGLAGAAILARRRGG